MIGSMAGHLNHGKPPQSRQRPRWLVQKQRRTVCEWVGEFGLWCPGHARPAHRVESMSDLQADHVFPLHEGHPLSGPLRVLCASCNNSRNAALRGDKFRSVRGGVSRGY